jgi:hypothetical protein
MCVIASLFSLVVAISAESECWYSLMIYGRTHIHL